ncbi:amidophosphoribosyltransferase [Lactococcus hodotermopsidis]|uniref:Amidophosphoribosyltransferase n=1 Tax=Pseudolactococcus hodotermopsidis TaxID=2709157 RepID=A0A6A0BFK0_9LACT|nr:ComF family protein [Lactococcus hodotermopsidis]GFH42607.1 amidophosphoribosyltransferase [Lactococcus hodotermopsidis]
MTTCLLCHNTLTPTVKFSDIFLSQVNHETICQTCFAQFELISDQHCQICYKPEIDGVCSECAERSEQTPHRAIFHYNNFAKAYFQTYKFNGDFRLRSAFDTKLATTLKNQIIVPIPVSAERLQTRGFNQLTGFLNSAKLPYLDILTKNETAHQSHKTRAERLSSENPFTLKNACHIPEKLVIFDDIYTTGTTLRHAISLLKNAGCANVSTFSLFR